MREIEIKLRVDNLKAVEEQLKANGCHLSEPIKQHDVIYTKDGDVEAWSVAKEGDITIRIRHLEFGASLTFKQQKSGEMDNLEYETEIKDPTATHQILLALGFIPGVEVKKVRRKGKLGDYEICLDSVEELGTFVELEKLVEDNADPIEVREELFKVLESLGLSRDQEEVKGYDTQIFQKLQEK